MSDISNIPDQPMGVNPDTDQQAQQDQVQPTQPTTAQSQGQQTQQTPQVQTPSQTPNAQSGIQASIQNAKTGVQNIKDAQAAQPQTPHASMFSKILETMSGGPTRYTHVNPQTGETTTVVEHRPKNAMASSILAAALSGMFAGEAAPNVRNPATGGLDLSGAAQAGAQVGQAAAQKPSQQAQSLDDAKRANLINTTDHNLKVHQLMLNNTKLQGDVMQSTVDDAEPIVNALDSAQPQGGQPVIQKQNVTEDELNKLLQDKNAHVTRDSVLPDGVTDVYDENGKQVMNPDGTPKKTFTYTVYDHNAMVEMTDELRKSNPELVSAASGQQLPVKALAKLWRQRGESSVAQGYVTDFQKRMDAMTGKNSTPIDFNAAVKANPTLAGLKPILGRYAGMDPDQALDQMRKDKVNPDVIGAFQKVLGISESDMATFRAAQKKAEVDTAARELKQQEASDKANTPEGKLDLQKKQLEVQQKQRELDSLNLSSAGLSVPKGFTPNPNAAQMESVDLQKDLQTKGVRIPANFESLYAVAHNAADLKTLPANPRKGSNQMSSQEGLAFIRQYINPQYQEGDYAAASGLSKELASTRQGTAGGSLLSAGVASNHLELLDQAATALQNDDTQALNKIANALGVQFGKSPAVTFNAIADQVNGEVGKVVAGGTPHEAELANLRKNLNTDQSPEQTKNVIKSYIALMSGRVNEINDRSQQYFGRDVKGVSPSVMRVFNKYGFAVGSQQQYTLPSGKQIFFPNKAALDSFKQKAGLQ